MRGPLVSSAKAVKLGETAPGPAVVLCREFFAEGRCLSPICDVNHAEEASDHPNAVALMSCPRCCGLLAVGHDAPSCSMRLVCLLCGLGLAVLPLMTRAESVEAARAIQDVESAMRQRSRGVSS